jgi:hypothetical protein
VVSITQWPLFPTGKSFRYPLDRRIGGLQSRSERRGEEKNIPASAGNRSPIKYTELTRLKETKHKLKSINAFRLSVRRCAQHPENCNSKFHFSWHNAVSFKLKGKPGKHTTKKVPSKEFGRKKYEAKNTENYTAKFHNLFSSPNRVTVIKSSMVIWAERVACILKFTSYRYRN